MTGQTLSNMWTPLYAEIQKKIVGFFEGDEDEIDDTEYKSDDDDEIDSTEDEGNDDDTTRTGGKIIYIYI